MEIIVREIECSIFLYTGVWSLARVYFGNNRKTKSHENHKMNDLNDLYQSKINNFQLKHICNDDFCKTLNDFRLLFFSSSLVVVRFA